MTENAEAQPTTCNCRRCGRKLTSLDSISRGYGPTCFSKIAKSAKASTDKPNQVAKAIELIEVGGIVAVHHGRAFRVVASNGTDTYLTAPSACTCAAGLRGRYGCYHRTAAAILTAA